jgi:NADP-dependent 3-hydroxy acid dehydrogenase YdfG
MGQFVRNVVITGASAGLGQALALLYAEHGRTLGLLGRNQERLAAVAAECRAKGADVVLGMPDVTNFHAFAGWMQNFATEHPIDLLMVNAGAFTGNGPDSVLETLEQMSLILRTNLESGHHCCCFATNACKEERPYCRRRIAGSVASACGCAERL